MNKYVIQEDQLRDLYLEAMGNIAFEDPDAEVKMQHLRQVLNDILLHPAQ